MSVILQNCCPPLVEVGKLGGLCLQVYSFLWESAYKDVRYDKRLHLSWEQRRDCGGTTEWSVKGIADVLGSSRNKVSDAVDKLLDNGFIIAEAFIANGRGTKHTQFRVVHPTQVENVRHANEIIGTPPSVRRKNRTTRPINPHIDEAGKQEIKSKVSKEEKDFFQFLEDDYVENFKFNPYKGWKLTDGTWDDDRVGLAPAESYEASLEARIDDAIEQAEEEL